MLGNIEELRDYHKHVMLPKMETAVDNAAIMRYISPQSNNIHPCTQTPTILEVIPLQLFKSYCAEYDKFYKNNLSHGKNI